MLVKKTLTIGSAILLVAAVSVSSYAAANGPSPATTSEKAAASNSGTSDANEQYGFLDLRSAHMRVGAETVNVRLTTYGKWRPGWLLQCRDAIFSVGWLDDEVQVDIDKRDGQRLRAVIKQTNPLHVVGRVRAQHPSPRVVTFAFPAGKLQSSDGKWFAFSASPADKDCRYQYYFDNIPDDGRIVP